MKERSEEDEKTVTAQLERGFSKGLYEYNTSTGEIYGSTKN